MMERVILKTIGLLPESFFSLCYGFKPVVIDGQRLDSKARLLCDIDRKNATPVRDTPLETTRANLERLSSALTSRRKTATCPRDYTSRRPIPLFPFWFSIMAAVISAAPSTVMTASVRGLRNMAALPFCP